MKKQSLNYKSKINKKSITIAAAGLGIIAVSVIIAFASSNAMIDTQSTTHEPTSEFTEELITDNFTTQAEIIPSETVSETQTTKVTTMKVTTANTTKTTAAPTTAIPETTKKIPIGSSLDLDTEAIQKDANDYIATLDDTVVDSTLSKESSCYSSRICSFNNTHLLSDIKGTAKIEHDMCISSGYCSPLRMYIYVESYYKPNLDTYYYYFYILYMN